MKVPPKVIQNVAAITKPKKIRGGCELEQKTEYQFSLLPYLMGPLERQK